MKRKIICAAVIGIAAAGLLEIFRCSSPLAGNGSQTPNGQVSAMVYNPDGTPAAHAKVMFYPINYNPHTGGLGKTATVVTVDSTTTNDSGNYTAMLDTGSYNIIASGSDNLAYQDSIKATKGGSVYPPACTLKTPGTIRGIVQLQPGDDPETVFILFMGTYTFSMPIDTTGTFTTAAMAAGSYWVRILTSLPNYQVLDTNLTVIAGTQNVLPQPIKLKYTGIPIPTGLSATYDSVHGVVTVRWNKVTFQNLKGYIVYRNDTSTTLPQQISGNSALTDTFFNDTIFHDLLDTSNFVYEYRVKVQDKNANIGDKFSAPCEVTAASPTKVRTFITLKTLNTISDTASINDSVKIIASYQNQTRKNSRISWYVEKSDSLVKSKGIASQAGSDTLMNIWRTPGDNKVFVKIQDTAGTVWEDSIIVTIVLDAPVVIVGNDTTVKINDTVRLHASATERYGSIIKKWEWNIGNTGFRQTATGDTIIIAPADSDSLYVCVVRVTNNSGITVVDSMIVDVVLDPPIAYAGNDTVVAENSQVTLYGSATEEFGTIVKWEWNINNSGFVQTSTGVTTITTPDSLIPVDPCILRATDDDGLTGEDTVNLQVGIPPVAHAGNDTALARNSTVTLHGSATVVFGTIVKWEWNINNSGFVQTSTGDTIITAPDSAINVYPCILRVTDNYGNFEEDTVNVQVEGAWSALGSGTNNIIYALTVDKSGNLYAGGVFTTAGSVSVNGIAKWNGSVWSALGSGASGGSALALDSSGNLYTTWGSTGGSNSIAKWNGISWSTLGSGMNNLVQALAFDKSGNLYAGGYFTTAGGIAANHIAKWNGSSWSALGNGMNDYVQALAFDGSGNLYAGGYFTTAGGVAANYIAKWDGSAWSALGSGMNSSVHALAVDGSGNLYAGGTFTIAGGVATNDIAKWDGNAWSALSSGMSTSTCWVYALAFNGSGNLYTGAVGAVMTNYIDKWDGTSWSTLGSGMTSPGPWLPTVWALAVDGSGNLYAGGQFTNAGGVIVNNIAEWK